MVLRSATRAPLEAWKVAGQLFLGGQPNMTIAHRFLDRRALTKLHAITDVGASVSPDGRQIAFGRGQAHEIIGQVYMMNADRSGAHAVPSDLRRDGWI